MKHKKAFGDMIELAKIQFLFDTYLHFKNFKWFKL